MNATRYFKIGLFVMSGLLLIIVGIILFGSGVFEKNKIYFETYFDESVQGLNVGSPVKYRGVQIGSVAEITFAGEVYDIDAKYATKCGRYVMVKMVIDHEVFVKKIVSDLSKELNKFVLQNGLRLKLASLGITGMAYLEIDFVDISGLTPLFICWEPSFPYIPSFPNTMARLEVSVNNLMTAMESDFFPLMENMSKASENVPEVMTNLNETLIKVNSLVENQKFSFSEITENIRLMTGDLKELLATLKKHPSQIVFSQKPPKSELVN